MFASFFLQKSPGNYENELNITKFKNKRKMFIKRQLGLELYSANTPKLSIKLARGQLVDNYKT
jgi:ribosome-binding factor A